MRLHLCAIGRLRAGPERALVDDYLSRFNRSGRALGLGPATEHEVEDRKGGGMAAEGELLARTIPAGAAVGVAELPMNAPVEIELVAEITP
jgi:23S rRNA (pseudouridine1915-N3)-methyltransferase